MSRGRNVLSVAPGPHPDTVSANEAMWGPSMMRGLRWFIVALVTSGLTPALPAQGEMQELRVVTRMITPLVVTQHGELIGFSIELWNKLAERMQVGTRYHVVPDVGALLEEVRSGKADLGIAAIAITPEREEQFDFSEPILNAGLQIMVRSQDHQNNPKLQRQLQQSGIKGPEDLPGKRVATSRGSTGAAFLREINAEVYEFGNIRSAYSALLDSKVDAVVFSAPALLHYAANEGRGRVEMAGPLFRTESYGIVFRQNDPWRRRVNEALGALREDGTYQQLYERWFARSLAM